MSINEALDGGEDMIKRYTNEIVKLPRHAGGYAYVRVADVSAVYPFDKDATAVSAGGSTPIIDLPVDEVAKRLGWER